MSLLALLVGAPPAHAAFPRLILVSGLELDEPIVLEDVDEIVKLMGTMGRGVSIPRAQLAGRPYFDLALFWGDTMWEPYVSQGRLDELRYEQGNQFGRLYPALRGKQAAIELLVNGRPGPWPVRAKAVAIFTRHGVPTALPGEPSDDSRWPWLVGGSLAGAAVLLLIGLVAWRRRSRPRAL